MMHLAGSPRAEELNLGDGLLSVMLTVSETKLAYIQYLREQATHANTRGKTDTAMCMNLIFMYS